MGLLDKISGTTPATDKPLDIAMPPALSNPTIFKEDDGHDHDEPSTASLKTGDLIRLPNYETKGGYRLWKVLGVHPGALGHESTVELRPLDVEATADKMLVPTLILDHSGFDIVD